MGKEGNNHLKSITCQVFLIFSNLSSPRGGVLLIHYPRGPFQSPKVTKNATKIIRTCLAGLFMRKEGNSHLKSITCSILLIFTTSFPSWVGASPVHHPRAPLQSPKMTKNAIKITRSCLAGLFMGKEGNNCLESITCSVFLICPTQSLSWDGTPPIHHHRGSSKPQSDQKCHHDNQISLSRPLHRERGAQSPEIYHL